jgi:oligopeptide transport system substrate-binding protein
VRVSANALYKPRFWSLHGAASNRTPEDSILAHTPRTVVSVLLALAAITHTVDSAHAQEGATITYNVGADPRTLDPALANGVPEAHVILNIIEGLTRTDAKGEPVPAIAERWGISPDAKTYTFHLRDAKWANGEPVTAQDFVHGWLRNLRPETAGEYAYMLYLVEGAEEFNAGRLGDPAKVGVRALDDRTLEIRLKNPTPYFLSALAHYAFAPLKESWVKAHPQFASEPASYPCNGPFKLKEWRHGDRLVLQRNPAYYNAGAVRVETLVMTTISNESTALLQWEAGEIDITDTVPLPDIPRLKAEGKYRSNPYLGVYYVAFQNTKKPFDDPRVRRAFSLAIRREQIARAILRGGQPAAYALVPPGITMNGRDYRADGGALISEDAAEAKRLLAEAGYPGGRGFPRVRYLFNDMESHRTIGEALQDMWRTNLGVRVDLDVQEWKVYLQNRKQKNYQAARAGWIGDYFDAITFLDMFTSASGNNDFGYMNPEFDRIVEQAKAETDPVLREKLLREAERMVVARDMAVAPIYF